MDTLIPKEPIGSDGLAPEANLGARAAEDERNVLRELWAAIMRRKWLILGATLAVFVLAAAVILTLAPTYRATGILLIETRRPEAVRLNEAVPERPSLDAEVVANEVQVLQSRSLAEEIVRRLGLEHHPDFVQPRRPSLLGGLAECAAAAAERMLPESAARVVRDAARAVALEPAGADDEDAALDTAVTRLQRYHLAFSPVGRSRVVQITATAPDPKLAAALVNTAVDAYIASQSARREEETRRINAWLKERLGELRARADASARAEVEFRAAQRLVRGVARGDSVADIGRAEISEVNSQLVDARARRAEAAGRLEEAERAVSARNADVLAAVLGSRTIQELRTQESQAAARKAEMAARLGPAHPSLVAVNAELGDIRTKIAAETQRIVASARSELKLAQETEERLVRRLQELRAEVARVGTAEVKLEELTREADADRALVGNFITRSRETDPEVSFEVPSARVLSRGTVPQYRHFPKRKILLSLALAVSLGVGAALALAVEALSRGFRSMAQIERTLGLASLGLIPQRRRRRDRADNAMFKDAISSLCARLLLPPAGERPRSLLVTSALATEGKTTTSSALAWAAAERGLRVLLVDGDLRCSPWRASKHSNAAHSGPGLAEILSGEAAMDDVVRQDARLGLSVLRAGRRPADPARVLTSEAMDAFLRKAKEAYDLVVVDSAPVLVGADVWQIAQCVDRTILLVRWARTPQQAVSTALRQLEAAGGRVAGAVLTLVDTRQNARYTHGEAFVYSPQLRRYYDWAGGAAR